ncbi:MAG: sulfatase-like hydrolase/transferase, partial [Spirochaetaceae bacterium]|nr:sulfatase-like hydrolase/transferase [Spirochaetaceae bacterium]
TPNIDSIGLDGISYSQAYSSAPICSPSRAGLLTGRYQNRYGFDSQPMTQYAGSMLEYLVFKYFINTKPMYPIKNKSIPNPDQIERQGMPPTEILLSEALSASGYHCDAVGKWHLGYGELQHPDNRGFDSFFGFIDAFSYFINPDQPGVESWQFEEFSEKHIWKQKRDGYSAVQRDGLVVQEKEHLTDAFAREAVERIHAGSSSDDPFFLYLPFSAPHTPFQALSEYTSRFSHIEDPRKRIYYALISQLDDAVGRILIALDETGESENTLVIFSSDNGGATYTGATGNDPLRGGKMSHFEGGLSVPLMMRWPERIEKGLTDNSAVIQMDLFNTIMSSADIPLPADRVMDGIDLLDSVQVNNSDIRPLFWRSDYNHIVQYGKWKLMMNDKDGKTWLYNIVEDREE